MKNEQPNQFEVLAKCYDILNGADYEKYAEFIQKLLTKHGTGGKLLLDLACGTGSLTLKLADAGFDMTGIDCSPEMLSIAYQKASETEKNILFLCQNMRDFELYGTVDGIICTLDGINYLTNENDLSSCFSKIYNYLNYGGLFIFDVNTPWKFENVFSNRDFFLHSTDKNAPHTTDYYLGWKSKFNKRNGLCEFDLTVFSSDSDGKYNKFEESQVEKSWDNDTLISKITQCGLEIVNVYSNFDFQKVEKNSEKWFFIAKKPII